MESRAHFWKSDLNSGYLVLNTSQYEEEKVSIGGIKKKTSCSLNSENFSFQDG